MICASRVLFVLLVVLAPAVAFAAGFRLPEQDAKALGMSAAVVAQADTPSAIYYNPAGLTQLKGNWVAGGGTLILAQGAQFEGRTKVSNRLGLGTQGTKGEDQVFFTPDLFFVSSLGSERLRLGFGVYTPFGLGRRYEDQNRIFRDQLNNIELKTVNFNPTIAYKISDAVSVGAGLDLFRAQVIYDFTAFGTFSGTDLYTANARAEGDGLAYNVGVLITPHPKWKIGLNYRSISSIDLKGNVDIRTHSAAASAAFAAAFSQPSGASARDTAHSNLTLPDTFAIGVSFRPTERLTLEVDADWTGWSTYDEFPFNTSTSVSVGGAQIYGPTALTKDKDWRDTWTMRVGGQYKAGDRISLRAGYLYDRDPIPEENYTADLPDGDRQAGSIGIGYAGSRYTVDFAYAALFYRARTVKNYDRSGNVALDGTFKSMTHLFGLTLAYQF
ncbi:MAG: outer membrane protein transport protein [Candidatus Tectomicrobia bacterium]|uniref:Outer membrane protein transport protein n=1 Tax=Tectimicrobiota bacterium TaxID=2528274 RepID=A0A932GMM0_UNCTE|nr:outer membrane protein transport protein [Candidatus Tectomicrobia bacterium]